MPSTKGQLRSVMEITLVDPGYCAFLGATAGHPCRQTVANDGGYSSYERQRSSWSTNSQARRSAAASGKPNTHRLEFGNLVPGVFTPVLGQALDGSSGQLRERKNGFLAPRRAPNEALGFFDLVVGIQETDRRE